MPPPEPVRAVSTPAFLAAVLISLGAGPAGAGPEAGEERPEERLRKVEESLDRTRNLSVDLTRRAERHARELAELKRRLVIVAGNAQDREARMTELEAAIAKLNKQRARKTQGLRQRQAGLARLVAALQRMAQHPPVALIALPADPADTVRSAIVLRSAMPRIERQAAELRAEIVDITSLSRKISVQRDLLSKAGNELEREREKLAKLVKEKVRIERRTRDRMIAARTRTEELAKQAGDLRELLARLAARKKKKRDSRAAATTGAESGRKMVSLPLTLRNSRNWPLPARGRILRNFGERIRAGSHARGITVETRPKAQVVSPSGGTVVFSGPFRGYGELLIIEYAGGYHILMSGMARIDAAVGDEVLVGEPIGVMSPDKGGKPKLYLELRRQGVPVNPLPWLSATRNKVSG